MKKILNSSGMSLMEIMIGIGLFGVMTWAFIGGSSYITKQTSNVRSDVSQSRILDSLLMSVRGHAGVYKVNFDPRDFIEAIGEEELQNPLRLPLAWNDKVITTIENCPKCAGRLGFIVSPVPSYRGMYKLTIRMTHPSIKKQGLNFKDFDYLIKGK